MDQIAVQRVLVEYSRIVTDLEELEAASRADLELFRRGSERDPGLDREDALRAEQLQLGVLEGLVQAQLAILSRRQAFSRSHRPGSAEWVRTQSAGAAGG